MRLKSLIARVFTPVLMLFILLLAGPAGSQDAEVLLLPADQPTGADSLAQQLESADTLFNDGLMTMNEDTLRRAAEAYEDITLSYPNDPRMFGGYFASAYIHMDYLQGLSDFEHAKSLMSLLINNHPSSSPDVADAHIVLAHLEYRCLRNYREAQNHLSAVLNSGFLAAELGYRDMDVKVLLAKCRQKLGEYEKARVLWEQIYFTNPELDTEGRYKWIQDSNNWFLVDDGTIRLFFENGVERDDYTSCLARFREGLAIAESTWDLRAVTPVDIYLYKSTDSLFDHTLRSGGFALPVDGEIHMSFQDYSDIYHLAGWVVSQRINIRPEETTFPLLRAGFDHYFLAPRQELDELAAREIYYYGGVIADTGLLFPLSFDYTFSDEYNAMSASFLHYLIEEGRVSTDRLKMVHRLLRDNPQNRWVPPLMAGLMSLSYEEGGVARWAQGLLVSPEQLDDLFRIVLGVDLSGEIAAWQQSLASDIAAVQAELGSLSADVQRVDIDLTTPEDALRSWWEAYRSGDFDGMIESSTREMADLLEQAREIYRAQGVLDQVIIDYFVRPYRSSRMVVTQVSTYADNIYVFETQIERGAEVEQRTIVVRLENGLWKVDAN